MSSYHKYQSVSSTITRAIATQSDTALKKVHTRAKLYEITLLFMYDDNLCTLLILIYQIFYMQRQRKAKNKCDITEMVMVYKDRVKHGERERILWKIMRTMQLFNYNGVPKCPFVGTRKVL